MMTNRMARLRQSGSFIAGLLIGLSTVMATFAVTGADSGATQLALLVCGAPAVLVLGLALQALATGKRTRRRVIGV
jgi:hypothetical protein